MEYENICAGRFLNRPNRFAAQVELGGVTETVHVKNTGRCRELLIPGAAVYCRRSTNPLRKTKYDLVTVEKNGRLINMDSQAPNIATREWLQSGGLGQLEQLRPETVHGDSRFDFSFLKDGRQCFLEVKGVTLERHNVCAFPDAPTQRGVKHLRGLARAAQDGFGAYVLFVIQMEGALSLCPNEETDPDFAAALRDAARAGVRILAMDCRITPCSMTLRLPVPVLL